MDFIKSKLLIIIGLFTFILLQILFFERDSYTGIDFIIAISIILPIISICSRMKPKTKVFKYFSSIGKITLPVYILHPPIISATRIFLLQIGIDNIILHLIIELSVGWFSSIYVYKLAKKYKETDFLFYPAKYIKV